MYQPDTVTTRNVPIVQLVAGRMPRMSLKIRTCAHRDRQKAARSLYSRRRSSHRASCSSHRAPAAVASGRQLAVCAGAPQALSSSVTATRSATVISLRPTIVPAGSVSTTSREALSPITATPLIYVAERALCHACLLSRSRSPRIIRLARVPTPLCATRERSRFCSRSAVSVNGEATTRWCQECASSGGELWRYVLFACPRRLTAQACTLRWCWPGSCRLLIGLSSSSETATSTVRGVIARRHCRV